MRTSDDESRAALDDGEMFLARRGTTLVEDGDEKLRNVSSTDRRVQSIQRTDGEGYHDGLKSEAG